jgi:hypothetical protein
MIKDGTLIMIQDGIRIMIQAGEIGITIEETMTHIQIKTILTMGQQQKKQ